MFAYTMKTTCMNLAIFTFFALAFGEWKLSKSHFFNFFNFTFWRYITNRKRVGYEPQLIGPNLTCSKHRETFLFKVHTCEMDLWSFGFNIILLTCRKCIVGFEAAQCGFGCTSRASLQHDAHINMASFKGYDSNPCPHGLCAPPSKPPPCLN